MTNGEACSSFSSLFSDHRVVIANVSLRLPKSKPVTSTKAVRYIWSDLATDENIQARYAVEVKNRFQALKKVLDQSTSDCDKFVQSSAEAAEQCLRKVPRQKGKVKKEMEEAYRTYLADNKTKQLSEEYKGKKKSSYDV